MYAYTAFRKYSDTWKHVITWRQPHYELFFCHYSGWNLSPVTFACRSRDEMDSVVNDLVDCMLLSPDGRAACFRLNYLHADVTQLEILLSEALPTPNKQRQVYLALVHDQRIIVSKYITVDKQIDNIHMFLVIIHPHRFIPILIKYFSVTLQCVICHHNHN